ncbi:BPSS1187 family protein [Formosa sp. 3Alg 14/1]|uniref:BPSS1187 family protein n=1 Tax=Formosa sp. 3Alg 14/1 TaxID=3382190 RepID=UPI0039BE8AA1
MMFKKFVIFVGAVLCFNISSAQSKYTFPEDYKVLEVLPSITDSRITESNTPHLVVYNPTIKQGKLLLFMPGTGGVALKGPKDLFNTAVKQGYAVINLSYINRPAIAQICRKETLEANPDCASDFRINRIYGTNNFEFTTDKSYDAIVNRLIKLLEYLSEIDKDGNWDSYLEDGNLKWDQIAVSGQSQGGGMAAFIAKEHRVARVVDFSGGWDFSAKNKLATWYYNASKTPSHLWYGTYHVTEPMAKVIRASYIAMKIPENHIYPFSLPVPEGKKGHSNGVRNTGYTSQWIELLGQGN